MRRSTVVLVVLLGASLLVNAMLTLRLFRTPDPDPSTVCEVPVADRSGKVEDRASLQPALDQIAQEWSTLYQLDPAQLPQAKIAAQAYVDAISRANDQNKSGSQFDQQGTPQEYEFRLRSVGEQLAALNMLQAWMTPAQQERMRTQTMREIRIIDAEASIQSTPFEK